MTTHTDTLSKHFEDWWGVAGKRIRVGEDPLWELSEDYAVLAFPPRIRTDKKGKTWAREWTYATCGMSQPGDADCLELFVESPQETLNIVELLNMTAHFHRTGSALGLGHTLNFGRPWLPGSLCHHGFISLPYIDDPQLEHAHVLGKEVRILWLIPITREEREYKKKHGVEALEDLFQRSKFRFGDPSRPSMSVLFSVFLGPDPSIIVTEFPNVERS